MDTGPFNQSSPGAARDSHPELPIDSDVDRSRAADRRPLHLRPRYVYVVLLGGMLGTLARFGVESFVPVGALPFPTLVVNLTGAFALGVLLEGLSRSGPDRGWLRLTRLHLGTGFLGAYTTYSAVAIETVLLADAGRWLVALAYPFVTLALGAVLSVAGIGVATRRVAA